MRNISIFILLFLSILHLKIHSDDETKKEEKKEEKLEIKWENDIVEAREQAKIRGTPIFLWAKYDPHFLVKKLEDILFKNKEFIKKTKDLICIYVDIKNNKKKYEQLGGDGWFVGVDYEKLSWLNVFFYDSGRKLLDDFTIIRYRDVKELLKENPVEFFNSHIDKLIEKTGKGMSYEEYLKYKDTFKDVEKNFNERKYKEVIKLLKPLVEKTDTGGVADIAKKKLNELEEIARLRMRDAKNCEERNDRRAAVMIYKEIMENFDGLSVKDEAEKEYKRILGKK